jgi:hypothetical protein
MHAPLLTTTKRRFFSLLTNSFCLFGIFTLRFFLDEEEEEKR